MSDYRKNPKNNAKSRRRKRVWKKAARRNDRRAALAGTPSEDAR